MTAPKPYIFLSHSTKDNIFARDLAASLRDAGFKVWLDLDSIRDGDAWLRAIQGAVEGCSALLVVLSKHGRESEWVEREALLAMDLHKPLFVALVEDVPLPLHLINRQYTDFQRDVEGATHKLVAALRDLPRESESPQLPPTPGEHNFFRYIEQLPGGEKTVLIARDLYAWAQAQADSVVFGGQHTPGFHVRIRLNREATVFSVWAYARRPAAQVQFAYLRSFPPYNDADLRRSTLHSLNRLMPDGGQLDDGRADRRPTFPLSALDSAEALEAFKQIMAEMMDNLRSG